jgi:hypothetical protein
MWRPVKGKEMAVDAWSCAASAAASVLSLLNMKDAMQAAA